MEKVICKKSRKANWDYIGGEVFFGLLFVISLLLAILIPLEKDAEYVRYIFAGIALLFFYHSFSSLSDTRNSQNRPTPFWN